MSKTALLIIGFILLIDFSCSTHITTIPSTGTEGCYFDMGNNNSFYNIGVNDSLYQNNKQKIETYFSTPGSLRSLYLYDQSYEVQIQFFPLEYHWICSFTLLKKESTKVKNPHIKLKKIDDRSSYFKVHIGEFVDIVKQKLINQKFIEEQEEGRLVLTLTDTCFINNKYYEIPQAQYQAKYYFDNGFLYKMKFTMIPI